MVEEQQGEERAPGLCAEPDDREDRAAREELQEAAADEWPEIAVQSYVGGARIELVDRFGRRRVVSEIRTGWTTAALLLMALLSFALGSAVGLAIGRMR